MSNQVGLDKLEIKEALLAFRSSFIYVGGFSFFINLLMLVPPLYMLQVYDRVLASRSEETLLMLTLIVVWLFITMGLLEFARSRILVRLGSQMDARLNTRLYSAMLANSLQQPGSTSSQALSDLTSIRQFMTGNGVFAFFDTPWVPVYFLVLFLFHSWFGWFSIFAAVVLIILAIVNEVSTNGLMKKANAQNVRSNSHVSAQLRNAEVIHAMGMESVMRERWLQEHLEFLKNQSDASDRAGMWMNMSKTLRLMFQSLMLGLGAWLAIDNSISAGMVIAGSILLGRALAPIDQMIAAWKQLNSARVAYTRLNKLLQQHPEKLQRMSLPKPKGAIHFDGATVIPPGGKEAVLRAINFNVAPGDSLVILGASAAGKSSLLKALLGVWSPVAGKVRIDNAEVGHWNRDELGAHIGYLPQDVELFDGTIAENISRFGEKDSEQIIQAARLAGVDEMIRHLPDAYDSRIGLGGIALSGGQRQRIGLARAVYGLPPLIILDEPNASLDEVGEKALIDACRALKEKGITLVLVTHRTGILDVADKLLLLDKGMVKLFGSRDEVLAALAEAKRLAQGGAAPPANKKPGSGGVVNIPGV